MRVSARVSVLLLGLITGLTPAPIVAQTILTEGTNIRADISAVDGRIVFDLLGGIWIVAGNGGQAQELPNAVVPARSPKWSPSADDILYQAHSPVGNRLWLHNMQSNTSQPLNSEANDDRFAAWHPDGERIVFSSTSSDNGLDLWELDIRTGLRWRLTSRPGDELEAAWSADGRHLVYVTHDTEGWSLMLRRHGELDQQLLWTKRAIHAPSWRPDGSLITYLSETDDGYTLDMIILSDPPLAHRYSDEKRDYFLAPVSWLNRHQMIYTADGQLLTQSFDSRRPSPIRFRASVNSTTARPERADTRRPLPIVTPPNEKLIIRAARLFDGVQDGYRNNVDVVVNGATIAAVEARRDRSDATILDLGDVTILPGFIDIDSALPKIGDTGASLLAYGITTLVSDEPISTLQQERWHGEIDPGPRLIAAGDIALGFDLLLAADTLPSSPMGVQYQDMRMAVSGGPVILVSGLADSGTPGIGQLLNSRQAQRFKHTDSTIRHYAASLHLHAETSSIVLGSKPNGLPPGLALHAELRALAAAGLSGDQVLRAAGANIGVSLGLESQIGVVTPGAFADLVLVAGDPLKNVADTLKIVAVVRNGRFYSLVRLLESTETLSATQ